MIGPEMTLENTGETPPLWGEERPDFMRYGEGPTESAVRVAIEAIHAAKPLEPQLLALAQICRSLAKNIDAGNTKGRAIAHEADRLADFLSQLQGIADPESDNEGIPADVRELFELGSVPTRNDAAEIRDSEMLGSANDRE